MSAVNFADPEFEPTDEQLRELAREAFSEVAKLQREALARLRTRIIEERTAVLTRLVSR